MIRNKGGDASCIAVTSRLSSVAPDNGGNMKTIKHYRQQQRIKRIAPRYYNQLGAWIMRNMHGILIGQSDSLRKTKEGEK